MDLRRLLGLASRDRDQPSSPASRRVGLTPLLVLVAAVVVAGGAHGLGAASTPTSASAPQQRPSRPLDVDLAARPASEDDPSQASGATTGASTAASRAPSPTSTVSVQSHSGAGQAPGGTAAAPRRQAAHAMPAGVRATSTQALAEASAWHDPGDSLGHAAEVLLAITTALVGLGVWLRRRTGA